MPGDSLHPTNSGRISPLLKDRRAINTTLEAARDFARNRRRRPGSREYEVDVESAAIFAADLTEATGAASWQSRTIVSGAWANGTPTGTNNAYPVQCGGSAFTPAATSTSIMWEEPSGSGVYVFLPIQYASINEPGFVSTAAQTFNGVKKFQDGIGLGDGTASCNPSVYFWPPTPDTGGMFLTAFGNVFYFNTNTIGGGLVLECSSGATPSYRINDGTLHTGQSTTFLTGDGKTVTVKGGIITSVV